MAESEETTGSSAYTELEHVRLRAQRQVAAMNSTLEALNQLGDQITRDAPLGRQKQQPHRKHQHPHTVSHRQHTGSADPDRDAQRRSRSNRDHSHGGGTTSDAAR